MRRDRMVTTGRIRRPIRAMIAIWSMLLAWSAQSVDAAEIKGAYPVSERITPYGYAQRYRTFDAEVVEYKIFSDFEMTVWRVVEERFEDSTVSYVEGPGGNLFEAEVPGTWGYSNNNGLSIFFLDESALLGVDFPEKSYGEVVYEYTALTVNAHGIKAYECIFQNKRLRATNSAGFLRKPYKDSTVMLAQIGKFLSINGVDITLDKCSEKPQLLNKEVVARSERELEELRQAASQQ